MSMSSLLTFTTKIEGAYTALCRPVLEEFKISKTSFDILMFLSNNPQCYTAKEISYVRNIKPNVVSLHVEKLVNDGYLERQAVKGDRRKIRLVCTQQAEPVIEKGLSVQQRFYGQLMDGLTQQDLEGFRHCFAVIAHNADLLQTTR